MIDFKDIVLKYIEELRIHEYQVSESAFPHYHSVPKSYDKNLRYRQKLLERCEENQDLRIEVLQKCKSDVLYYINTFVWTYSPKDRPNDPVVPFITYNYQDYVIEKIYKSFGSDDIVIVKSRDMGATWMTLAVIEWAWHFHKSQAFLLVSRKEEYVDKYDSPRELFWKIDFIHKHQPYWMKPPYRNSTRPRDPYRRRRSLINAVTGATISGEATVEDVARGDRQTAIMIDEAAAIADLDKINASTRDATNCRIFVSTPKGHGVFEDVVELAHKEDRLIVLHWSMHPEKSKGLYCLDSKSSSAKFFYISGRYTQDDIPVGYEYVADGKLRSIWYDRECTRATNKKEIAQELDLDFHQSGGPVFSVHEINKLLSECKPPLKRAFFDDDGRMLESEVGNVRIWKDVEHQARYYIGIDASAGIGTDTSANSSCQVINVETKEIVAELTDNDIMIEELALLVKRMALHYNEAYVIWEANGYGMAFGKHLMQVLHYPYVYMRRQVTKAIEKLTNMPGWWSSPKEKLLLLNQFFIAIRTNNVKMWSKELIYELSEYIYTEDGSIEHIRRHGQGPHGDRVIAAALAYRGASDFLYVSAQKETQQATSIYCFAHRRRLHRISAENESW